MPDLQAPPAEEPSALADGLPPAGTPERQALHRVANASLYAMGVHLDVLPAEAQLDFLARVWLAHADRIRATCAGTASL